LLPCAWQIVNREQRWIVSNTSWCVASSGTPI
jgi:hypothetical protein